MKTAVKWLLRVVAFVGLTALLIGMGIWWVSKPLPQGEQGAAADALAEKMLLAINKSAWDSVGAVSWNFGNRQQHLWDKKRHAVRVRWSNYEVLVDINPKRGIAYQDGQRVPQAKNDALVEKAWKHWVNDAFWLNAPAKAFDPGTVRTLVRRDDGSEALLVHYTTGGNTPGDAYLWILDAQHRPVAWELWVSIVPMKGFAFSWENWQQTPEGAWLAQTHESKLFTLQLADIQTAPSAASLNGGTDPFAPLFE